MKKLFVTVAAGLGLAAMMAGAAYADPVIIKFEDPDADMPTNTDNYTIGGTCNGTVVSGTEDLCTKDNAEGFDYTVDAVTVNVTADSDTDSTALLQDLRPNNSGLAVISLGDSSRDDQVQVATGESVSFDFGTDVFLLGIDFNAGNDRDCINANTTEGPCGNFELIVDGFSQGIFGAIDDLLFLEPFLGTTFEVVATGPDVNGVSGFAIGSIKVSSVPEPGTLALLGAGLIGMGFARRRKTA